MSGALPARVALVSLAFVPASPDGVMSRSTWMSVCVLLNSSTTAWVPRRDDQNVITVGPPPGSSGAGPAHAASTVAAARAQPSARNRWDTDVLLVVERALSHVTVVHISIVVKSIR